LRPGLTEHEDSLRLVVIATVQFYYYNTYSTHVNSTATMKSSLLGAFCAAIFALISPALAEVSEKDGKKVKDPTPKPCTIRSPSSGHFFDLNSISVLSPDAKDKKNADDRTESWHAKGYDYGTNFTLNFCAPVVEELDDVQGVEKSLWRNVSAYYNDGRRTYSIGYG
jgi:cation-dependent mannose-6-phosphate receptor